MKHERIIFVIILFILGGFFAMDKFKSRDEMRGLQTMVEVLNDSVRVHKNKEGKLVAEKKSQYITIKELQKYNQELNLDKKGLKKEIGNLKNLVTYLRGKAQASGSGSVVLTADTVALIAVPQASPNEPTIFPKHFVWTDNYLALNGTLDYQYKLDFEYTYKFDYDIITYWKKKDLVVNITFSDPNLVTTDINSVVIKPQRKKFYERNWFWAVAGFAGGVFLVK